MGTLKIAILNAEAGGNKGAEAMLDTLVSFLQKKYPDSELFLEVSNNKSYYETIFLKKYSLHHTHLLEFNPKSIFNPYNSKISAIDVAIDIGGINFTGNSKKGLIRSFIRYIPFLLNRKKLIFFTQDLGPAKNIFAKKLGKYILNYSDGYFSRSQRSFDEAINSFKISTTKVHGPYPDATLLFKPSSVDNLSLPINYEKKIVILSPSAIMFKKHGEHYLTFFKNLFLQFNKEYQIVFLVHNFTKNFGNSDADICQQLSQKCPDSILINQNLASSDFKRIIGQARFVISSRYHVIVGALSQDVPAIAIGWNPKYLSFLKLYNKEKWNLDFQSESTLNEVINIIDDEDFFGTNLSPINDSLKKQVNQSFVDLDNLIAPLQVLS